MHELTEQRLDRIEWHRLSPPEALAELASRPAGLTAEEVAARQATFGRNSLPERRAPGLARLFLRQFGDPLIYILLAAGTASLVIGHLGDAAFILGVLVLNALIGTVQERKAETSAKALQRMMRIVAAVRRDGRRLALDAAELVPGDVVLLESGMAVPADIRLIETRELTADESLLTGESLPVEKAADVQLGDAVPLADRVNLLHAGSIVVAGRGVGVVCRTGDRTEIGRIARSLAEEAGEAPPLVVRLRRFSRVIAVVVLALIGVLAAAQFAQGKDPFEVFLLAVALAVAAIPEGLPVAVTVALTVASGHMARRNVIVRLLPAVEGLGACTLIASDKTGTLTENRLTVTRAWLAGTDVEIGGGAFDDEGAVRTGGAPLIDGELLSRLERLALTGLLCNEADFRVVDGRVEQHGDTVDVALLVMAAKVRLNRTAALGRYPVVGMLPFEAERRFAASFHSVDGRTVAHVKGAAETVLAMCIGVDHDSVRRQEQRLAEQGFRVLALASGETPDGRSLQSLEFLGLVGLIDPIRQEVPAAVARCHAAGVDVRMITGDHPATGLAIARQIGIADDPGQVLTGREMTALGDGSRDLDDRIGRARVFARVGPEQKTQILRSLQQAGHFVALTGDGVNDAPALRAAHIGVAMGRGGTDVARGAADLILTDDNFAAIVAGIEEGRIAYDNVRKVVWLLISTGAAEIVLFLLSQAAGLPLPLSPVQLLWLNLVTNGMQHVALAFERGEPGVLERPPRPPTQPLFDRLMIEETVLSGAWIGLVAFGVFYWLITSAGAAEAEARNILLLLMVLFENAHCFNCRSETRSVFRMSLGRNPLLLLVVIAAQAIHLGALFTPGLSDVLDVAPVSITTWASLLPLAASLVVVMEIYKFVRGRAFRADRRPGRA